MVKRLLLLAALLVGVTGVLIVYTGDEAREASAGEVVDDTTVVLVGSFAPGEGRAAVVRLSDGTMQVRLMAVPASVGERTRVYLLGAPRARSRAELDRVGHVDVGEFRAGAASYPIPRNTPLSRVQAVALWDVASGVSRATAELRRP